MTEKKAPYFTREQIEKILERVEEGTTTVDDAEVLRELLEGRYQGLSKKNEVS